MSRNLYTQFPREQLILRDYLAVDRTIVANERTFLAYARTALAFFLTGVTFIKFFDSVFLTAIGWIFVLAGAVTFMVGMVRYVQIKEDLNRLKRE